MSPRKKFLSALFAILNEKAVPYCILRNYSNIYQDTESDIDVAVEPEHIENFKSCLATAAAATNYHSVLQTRYVNFSYVYWHPEGQFIRVDVETEVRWRLFPVLTAKSVVGLRRKEEGFYIPHPRHESVILFIAAIWRGFLSDRYREQLARLYQQLSSPEELSRTFRAAFGAVGGDLARYQANILNEPPDPMAWKAARRSIVKNAFHDAPSLRAFFGYLLQDMERLWERLRQPPGISLLYASSARPPREISNMFEQVKFLYPTAKSAAYVFHLRSNQKPPARLGLRLQLKRLYTLFKGGLFVRYYQLPDDNEIPLVIRSHPRWLYPSRTFVCAENSRLDICLGHVKTGFMASLIPTGGAPVPTDRIIQFLSAILERNRTQPKPPPGKRGAFVVLAGLDGSGKTTVARNLCCMAAELERFPKIRYFHWRPNIFKNAAFPLPEHGNLPREQELQRNLFLSVLSAARLCKNLLLTNIAHAVRVRPLLRRNAIVLVDRYYYNYYLDPVSVKYYGPSWLLDRLRSFFPRPDLVVVLKAPSEVLRARKQELSGEQILRQNAILNQLRFDAGHTMEMDASQPAPEIARAIMRKLVEIIA